MNDLNSMLASLLLALPVADGADDPQWPQFLGPGGMATATGTRPVALSFDVERDVRWRAALPGGSSSPCIHGDHLFLTAHEDAQRHMIAIDRHTGRELWRRTIESQGVGPKAHVDADTAAPTPCTDGERVAFYFGGYGLVVLDYSGDLLWEKELPLPAAPFGIGTSPILIDDLVVLQRDGCPDSAIYAFDAEDGREVWQVPRLGYGPSFGTPFVWDTPERRELVVAGSGRLSALDPADGTTLWTVDGQAEFICTSPTADAGTLYFAAWSTGGASAIERARVSWGEFEFTAEEITDGPKAFRRLDANEDGVVTLDEMPESRAKDAYASFDRSGDGKLQEKELVRLFDLPQRARNIMVAVAAGGEGDVGESHVRWSYRRGLPYVCTPLLYDGRLYLVKAGGLVTCLDPVTGQAHFDRERLGDRGEYYASPVGVDGHVIVCSCNGTVYVLRAADQFELVTEVSLGEAITATPAVVDGTVYLRSAETLWAFGAPGS